MNFLIDTSILIEMLRKNEDVLEFLDNHLKDRFLTSSICETEIWEGVYREKPINFDKRKKNVEALLDSLTDIIIFDSNQAQIAGKIRSSLALKGENIGDLDILIAASAIASEAILLTKNTKHFSRIKNLEILTL